MKSSITLHTYNLFVLNLFKNGYLIYDKKNEKIMLPGKVKDNKSEEIKRLESYLQLIKMIIQIEKYFNVEFDILK